MRLWHQSLIPRLSRQHLLGQHRECCALRGKGWGKPHSTVDYVFEYSPFRLYLYHFCVIREMHSRGFRTDQNWGKLLFRGYSIDSWDLASFNVEWDMIPFECNTVVYPEHDFSYLKECLRNLRRKGFSLKRY